MTHHQQQQNNSRREELVEALSRAGAYGHDAEPITYIETHTADVFLAGDYAYKVKKPVNFGFCDFSTLELRREYTHLEIDLNTRLSSGVYLGVSEVNRDGGGNYAVDSQGELVEYALKMRRLSADDALASRIDSGSVDETTMCSIARKVAEFHRVAHAPGPSEHYGSLPTIRRTVVSNQDRAEEFAGPYVDRTSLAVVRGYLDAWLLERGGLIDARHRAGVPRECHGDLHAGNIFIEQDAGGGTAIQVIDSIEFNKTLRFIDPAADIAFLLMDLHRLGRDDLADAFLYEYLSASGDDVATRMQPFYSCYRAMVRCMANGLLARDSQGQQQAVDAAQSYLRVANEMARMDLPGRLLVVMCGVTGTGKSTVGDLLANAWQLEHLQTDAIRKELAGLSRDARTRGEVRKGIYSRRMSQKTYAEMERRAVKSMESGRGAVLDGTYLGRSFRKRAVELGRAAGATVIIVECTLPEEEVLRRLARRYESGESVSEGRPEVYAVQKPQLERVQDDEADAVARVNTGLDPDALTRLALREGWAAVLRATLPTPQGS